MRSGFRWRQGAGLASVQGIQATRIAWPRTLAAKQSEPLRDEHLRFIHEEARGGVLHCFLLDCSASMMVGERLALAKGILLALFDRARAARCEVALVCFGGNRADVRFGPAVPRWWNERWIAPVGGGGGTPFQSGIDTAGDLLVKAAQGKRAQQRWLWVLSDGRSSDAPSRPAAADQVMFVDFEQERLSIGRCAALAREWDARWLDAREVFGIVAS
ncbi:vWA domain-containing protein [Paraburkholderia azotifigens]|uniref:VWA domain-containing protein n=1 Tax=Paraburkholderia azotifigens TaxID=2057004 RepID=A0A5C6VEM7_9BURK|nr:VWA domain-containing protein [Paraburkholderia azotifigens]TXC82275.1 VWA domain-containing protein [Paraburkholderia azotifigens]